MTLTWLPWRRCAKTASNSRGRSSRLGMECLEDRSVPATFNVTTTLDDIVPANGLRSLREAITSANAAPGADVIVLPAGVFRITINGTGEDANATGDFDITGSVVIRGAGAGATVIDAQQRDRIFDVIGSINARFVGMTMQRGAPGAAGGAVRTASGAIALVSCTIVDNRATNGGGISAGTGNTTVIGSTVNRNIATAGGGGISTGGALVLQDSVVRRNLAGSSGGGIDAASATVTNSRINENSSAIFGGGMVVGTVTVTSSTFRGNVAINGGGGINATTQVTLASSAITGNSTNGNGGGIRCINAVTVANSTISGNFAGGDGGGILCVTASATRSTISGNFAGLDGGGIDAASTTLTRSTISGNTSTNGNGGGIHAQVATMTNSTISGNTSTNGNGGGIAIFMSGTATILNCTIVDNAAGDNGGGIWRNPAAANPTQLRNTIVARNYAGVGGPDVSGTFTSLGHNLIGDGSGGVGFTNAVNSDQVGTSASPIDPKLGALTNNGGPTKTHALLAGSSAIDRGDNLVPEVADQRGAGFARNKDGNGDTIAVVDIGAFEL